MARGIVRWIGTFLWILGVASTAAACSLLDAWAGGSGSGPDMSNPDSGELCTPNEAIRCDGADLVRCNANGNAAEIETCPLGCVAEELRCGDVDPSNDLAQFLDLTEGESALELGSGTSIDTYNGTVSMDGRVLWVRAVFGGQQFGPNILVLAVGSLRAGDVTVDGNNPLAIVSNGDISIDGLLSVSAHGAHPGPGWYSEITCEGMLGEEQFDLIGGSGGSSFGSRGGGGGRAEAEDKPRFASGGVAGGPVGNPELIPLRGGCEGPVYVYGTDSYGGGGGGAVQLVSRTRVSVSGILAANGGGGGSMGGGGSGGGVLIEAPVVNVSGSVLANGGGGGACGGVAEDGRMDGSPASGAIGACPDFASGNGGWGAAGSIPAGDGLTARRVGLLTAIAGCGGGGVGRIRINTVSGGVSTTGVVSPSPSVGAIAVR